MDRLFRGLRNKEGQVTEKQEGDETNTFKEVAFNSRTKKTLVRDGNRFIVVTGTDKSFLDTLRTLKYEKFDDFEQAVAFFKEQSEKYIPRRRKTDKELIEVIEETEEEDGT